MVALGLNMEEGDYGRLHRGGESLRLSKRLPGREVKEKISRPREGQTLNSGGVGGLGCPGDEGHRSPSGGTELVDARPQGVCGWGQDRRLEVLGAAVPQASSQRLSNSSLFFSVSGICFKRVQ